MHWIDHDYLPDARGTVERFIVNPHGEVDGLVLEYEPDRFVLVHLPPHLGPEITSAMKPGVLSSKMRSLAAPSGSGGGARACGQGAARRVAAQPHLLRL